MSDSPKINLLDLNRKKCEAWFSSLNEPAFRATQAIKWIHSYGYTDPDKMTNLSKSLREKLKTLAEVRLPEIVFDRTASDGTRKWLLKFQDGNCIETVFIPEENRGTLCVSSQVGCALNCSFCSTGKQGFNRNLTTGEIIGQLFIAVRLLSSKKGQHDHTITNVVMMGMGEPLLNLENVVDAMDLMIDDFAYGLSKRRVTLSTSGLIPEMQRLKEMADVSLAVSLHAPNDLLRNELVPINKKYPLNQLMDVCRHYFKEEGKRRITFEYVMLEEINDTPSHAHELVNLLHDVPGMVNLIPFNPFPGAPYKRSSNNRIHRFQDILIAAGITTIIRKTRGDDIDAACGQLVGKVFDKTKRSQRFIPIVEERA